MKLPLRITALLTLLIFFSACTTTQIDHGLALAKPIAAAAIGAAATAYTGSPAAGSVATLAFNDIWGAIAALRAGQPIASGANSSAVGNAIAAQIPPGTDTPTAIAALTTAAGLVNVPKK